MFNFFKEQSPTTKERKEEPFSFEKWLSSDLGKQYENKAEILNKADLLETLPEKQEIGIVDIDGKEHPFPSKEAIEEHIRKNPEFYKTKMEQGLTEIEIVPFGLPVKKLITTAREAIKEHHKEGKLFRNKKNQEDENEKLVPLETDERGHSLIVWGGFKDADADINESLIYYPKEFSKENHQGKTKREIIGAPSPFPGYNVILREKNLNIPREGEGETIKDRKQLEANKTPNEYLKIIQTQEQYTKETGLTPEDWLTIFLTHLEQTNQVIDDGKYGHSSYQLGAYFPASGNVARAEWVRFQEAPRQAKMDVSVGGYAGMGESAPDSSWIGNGSRTEVLLR